MSKTDIIIILFTVVYGLLLTYLFSSLHKLFRKQSSIKWNWLPLLTAWYLFLVILKNWWNLISAQADEELFNIIFFVVYGHLLFLIFLAVSSVLPDKVPEMGMDLESYFFQNYRYFWGVMAAVVLISGTITVYTESTMGLPLNIWQVVTTSVLFLLHLFLAVRKSYRLTMILVPLFTLVTLYEIIDKI
jgi:hypothetical protein